MSGIIDSSPASVDSRVAERVKAPKINGWFRHFKQITHFEDIPFELAINVAGRSKEAEVI
ncbi:MAG: hypothetical protein H0T92_18215 [Pyrinomonadaceae bacterium]|nr:hypothetical protein [Pyrinomonadaceae bacterium]